MRIKQSDEVQADTFARVAKRQGYDIGVMEGIEIGKELTLSSIVKTMHSFGFKLEVIADSLKINQDTIKKYIKD